MVFVTIASMTNADSALDKPLDQSAASDFVKRFADAWAARDGEAFLALWHGDGLLHYPFASRVVRGDEVGLLNDLTKRLAPELTWTMLDWTMRGDVIVVEWESSNRYGERVVSWRGVDKLTLRHGRVIEEVVYCDTAPLQALLQGVTFDPLIRFPERG
jgi:ketosteroid isomerase-like protein